ncbi:MAG: mannonate dehydratase [Gammaproteobacteria bacterium]|nr:mannonate dehydratase [Gammaproteobacteria bacterium]
MIESWRWFGPEDPVTLEQIVEAGAKGIVTALDHIPTGEIWPLTDIEERKRKIESYGLTWKVVESVPVHTEIKSGSGHFKHYISNYQQTITNLGENGIECICYNFMPVLDWTRTNLKLDLPNFSQALSFDISEFAAYDIFILERANASESYPQEIQEKAQLKYVNMTEVDKEKLEKNIIAGLPGGEGSHTRESLRKAINLFKNLGENKLREHLYDFLKRIIPVAEKHSINMAIHPDDPPFGLFGLPRVVSTADDAEKIMREVPSLCNGLTLCAGSFGARSDNDLISMVENFGEKIHFTHLRNIRRKTDGSFTESEHLAGDNDMVGIIKAILEVEEKSGREMPMRPDHGHTMGEERHREDVRPGYSYSGRMKGLAELRGVIHAVKTLSKTSQA